MINAFRLGANRVFEFIFSLSLTSCFRFLVARSSIRLPQTVASLNERSSLNERITAAHYNINIAQKHTKAGQTSLTGKLTAALR